MPSAFVISRSVRVSQSLCFLYGYRSGGKLAGYWRALAQKVARETDPLLVTCLITILSLRCKLTDSAVFSNTKFLMYFSSRDSRGMVMSGCGVSIVQ